MNYQRYKKYPQVDLPNRTWPSKSIDKAPNWCSVDLRDGNQALKIPMTVDEKVEFFKLLVEVGFKEIEVGFPSASFTEYRFLRTLVEKNLIPDDVRIQVLTQAREELIVKTYEALIGVKKAVIHVYNSTSTLQRDVVFKKNKQQIIDIAINGAKIVKEYAKKYPETDYRFEYSPESFTGTELDYALEICEAVIDVWQPTPEKKAILNLPATVEMATANIYADQIEWFSTNIKNRDCISISLHAHNDRGTGVAATELAIMAGADRVEGTLFGNGERTGNVDILTVALNLFSQGVDPELDFSHINKVIESYEKYVGMKVHERHPYAGELVYTAFSGSHQDAIRKGLIELKRSNSKYWEVPYLPIDPMDVGRKYEALIRINSQSGKGGIAYIMEKEFGFDLPKGMHPEFGKVVQEVLDRTEKELAPQEIYDIFKAEYLELNGPFKLVSYEIEEKDDLCNEEGCELLVEIKSKITIDGEEKLINATGNGPIDAFFKGLKERTGIKFILTSYAEHALTEGSDSKAVTYIELEDEHQNRFYGVGMATSTNTASLKAIICSMNRFEKYLIK